jgi:N6-L-threonylcarbamoyladenine synthase
VKKTNIYILAIESSCDDTSCAVLCDTRVLANKTAGQDIHRLYGGVVPELASRDHQKNIVPVVEAVVAEAGLALNDIDAIAVTRGPGLMGSLLVGLSFAKSLSLALNKPLIEVNHMQGHVLAHFIESSLQTRPQFPFLCLTASGGHTQLVLVKDHLDFEVLGETIDDAIGEAFDKAAKILGLPYPGGPLIDKYAANGDAKRFVFASTKTEGYDYSFSGIKTSFLYFVQNALQKDKDFITNNLNDICASYQSHLVNVVLKNVRRVLKDHNIKHFAIAGGVSANSELRKKAMEMGEELGVQVYIPEFQYCTDNAAMIGIAALFKYYRKEFSGLELAPLVRMPL